MQKELEFVKETLLDKNFIYQDKPHLAKKRYNCIAVGLVIGKLKITTDSRVFLINESEVEDFIAKCEVEADGGSVRTVTVEKVVEVEKIVEVAVVQENQACEMLSDGLIAMFNKFSQGNANEKDLNDAKAMVEISSKLIDIEKIRFQIAMVNRKR